MPGVGHAAWQSSAVWAAIMLCAWRDLNGGILAQVAGMASEGVAHLLALGKSVGAHLFGEEPKEVWPAGAAGKGTALRFAAAQLEADLAAVAAAFGKALTESDEALMSPFRGEGEEAGDKKPQLVRDLEVDAASAAHRLREAFRCGCATRTACCARHPSTRPHPAMRPYACCAPLSLPGALLPAGP